VILRRLALSGVRNLKSQTISLPEDLVVFVGPNAQGKTNLLEAAYLLVRGYSFRTDRLEEAIAWGKSELALTGEVVLPEGRVELGFFLRRGERARRTFDGKAMVAEQRAALLPRVFLFRPDDLAMVKGAPELRRRFLDEDLGVLLPSYRDDLGRVRRLLRQKAAALRQGASEKVLGALDEVLFEAAGRLTRLRARLILELAAEVNAIYRSLSQGEEARLRYRPGLPEGVSLPELARLREEERRRATPLWGPHRDDIELTIGENDARRFASQGQQRSLAIALKVAALRHAAAKLEDTPVLLLDDVLSELDEGRREALAALLQEGQTLLTTAGDGPPFDLSATVLLATLPTTFLVREGGVSAWPSDPEPRPWR